LILALLIILPGISQSQTKNSAIHSGIALFDQYNKEVNAHGACIVKEGNLYYLFGEYKSDTANVFTGFSCYSSTDLMNWKFEKIVLPVQSDGLLGPNRVGERVKVMRCPHTGEFVMFMHADDRKYTDPLIGYATCKIINGDYKFQGALLHEGNPIKKWDMGTFQDTDGKGYLLIHHGTIYELADNYKSAKRIVASQVPTGESPAIFRKNGIYFWLSSHLTSWERNDNYYMTATSLEGPWKMGGLVAPEGTLTWNSQCSYVFPISTATDTLMMYMGDRWSFPKQGSAATYVWQPLTVEGDSTFIPEFQSGWRPDFDNAQSDKVPLNTSTIIEKANIKSGDWKRNEGGYKAKEKGAAIRFSFEGTRVGIIALSNPTSGYAQVKITDRRGKVVVNTIVDFYSKYVYSSLKFLSPYMKKGNYQLSIEVLGEHPKWSDKRKNEYGSTDDYVIVEDVFTVND
jgi:hypothetical protein